MQKEPQTIKQIISHLPPNVTIEVIDDRKSEGEKQIYRGPVIKLYRDREDIAHLPVSLFNPYEKEEETDKGTKLRIAVIHVQS